MRCRPNPLSPVASGLCLSLTAVLACGDDGSTAASPDARAGETADAGPETPDASSTSAAPSNGEAAPFECGDDGSDWPLDWQAMECEAMNLVNERRAEGAECGDLGSFEAVDAVEPHAVLTANAREHSQQMLDNDDLSFDDAQGRDLNEWSLGGYVDNGSARVDIASGIPTAAGLVDGLMASPGDCTNLMAPTSRYIGVGVADLVSDAGMAMPMPMWTVISAD